MSISGLFYSMVLWSVFYPVCVLWGSPNSTDRFMPADALWAFCMACNVYLTFFHKYDADRLRRLEWKYLLCCYGLPFIPALSYFFIETKERGRIYGSATVRRTLSCGQSMLSID